MKLRKHNHGVAKNNNKSQQVGSGAVLPRQGEGWGRGGEARRGTHRRGTQGEKEERQDVKVSNAKMPL